MSKEIVVAFISERLKTDFENLKKGKYEDERLYDFIDRAIDDLKKDPLCGTKILKRLWPKEYIRRYGVTNLWKYDLPNAWRIIYTIESDEVRIVNIILEWFDHKEYEKRFNY
ncbi:type II toxin-antitoxin system RelE/ParE family toxin [Candidatus Woesearchaeota archaeon]|nr:type II toxin-antitoxin system RelE/ParE family toxin [Candidatus Woesearchaeota archaeon]